MVVVVVWSASQVTIVSAGTGDQVTGQFQQQGRLPCAGCSQDEQLAAEIVEHLDDGRP